MSPTRRRFVAASTGVAAAATLGLGPRPPASFQTLDRIVIEIDKLVELLPAVVGSAHGAITHWLRSLLTAVKLSAAELAGTETPIVRATRIGRYFGVIKIPDLASHPTLPTVMKQMDYVRTAISAFTSEVGMTLQLQDSPFSKDMSITREESNRIVAHVINTNARLKENQ